MFVKKVLRYLGLTTVGLVGFVLILVCATVAPISRTPVEELPASSEMKKNLEAIAQPPHNKITESFSVGFAKVNITPPFPVATAGYGNRKGKLATGIKDSVFVRTMIFENGRQKVAVVSADLLLIPPMVTQRLDAKLKSIGFSLDNTYLGATHTHNSVGNWAGGAIQFMYGKYDDDVVEFLSDQIVKSIAYASKNLKKATLRSGAIPVGNAVQNRLINGGPEDSLLRIVEVKREDSTKLLLMSFTAHATCLYSKDREISRDYPGKLVDTIEDRGYAFAMFLAGAVGSHKPSAPQFGPDCIDWMANEITTTFLANRNLLTTVGDTSILMMRVPVALSDPQVKLTNSLKVRSWFFKIALGEFPAELKCLRIGNVLLLGTPCDFSGEFNPALDAYAAQKGFQTIVTSFNGGYVGYLTPRNRYDVDHYETKLMNWYAPGTGEEVEQSLEFMIDVVSKE